MFWINPATWAQVECTALSQHEIRLCFVFFFFFPSLFLKLSVPKGLNAWQREMEATFGGGINRVK